MIRRFFAGCSFKNWRVVVKPALVTFLAVSFSCKHPGTESAANKSGYASLDSAVTYVGMNTCRQCHADKYETYIRTGMGRSFGEATREKSSARFTASSVVRDPYLDLSYHPHWEGDRLLISEYRMTGGDTAFRRDEEVRYIVGSGQHTNSHLRSTNGYLYQLPLTFYTQQVKWDLPPGFENGHNSRFSRKIELECISCHNGYPKLIEGSENKYSMIPLGIDCERCHGPGSRHVRLKQQGEIVDTSKAIDYSIVNPAKLPIDYQLDICQRCHIQGNAVTATGKGFFDFKPGNRLSEVMDVYMPVYKGQEHEHIMASHAERLKMSSCFIRSKLLAEKSSKGADRLRPYRDALTCVTCHNPHVSVKETGPETFNNACRSCHQPESKMVAHSTLTCTAPPASRKKSNDDCCSCHMPKNNTIDIPHVTTTDHYIRRPVKIEYKRQVKEFVTLACVNNPAADRRSKGVAYLNYFEKFVGNRAFLDSAAVYLSTSVDGEFLRNYHALVRLAFLREDYPLVLALNKRHASLKALPVDASTRMERAWTSYRIAESYQHTGSLSDAVAYYKAAVELMPYQLSFRSKYAAALEEADRPQQAEEQYVFLLKEDPENASACVNYGYLLLTTRKDLYRADSLYTAALALDPDHVQALINKTGTSVMMGDLQAAKKYVSRALKIAPANKQAQLMKQELWK